MENDILNLLSTKLSELDLSLEALNQHDRAIENHKKSIQQVLLSGRAESDLKIQENQLRDTISHFCEAGQYYERALENLQQFLDSVEGQPNVSDTGEMLRARDYLENTPPALRRMRQYRVSVPNPKAVP